MRICFDLDGTLCRSRLPDERYIDVETSRKVSIELK